LTTRHRTLGSSVPALAKGARDKIWTIANRGNIKVQSQLPWNSEGNPKGLEIQSSQALHEAQSRSLAMYGHNRSSLRRSPGLVTRARLCEPAPT